MEVSVSRSLSLFAMYESTRSRCRTTRAQQQETRDILWRILILKSFMAGAFWAVSANRRRCDGGEGGAMAER